MREIIDALKAAGFTYDQNVWDQDFDYPLDFFVRDTDKANILGEVEEAARGIIVRMRPFDKLKEWYIEDFEEIPTFIEEFRTTFELYWLEIEATWNNGS